MTDKQQLRARLDEVLYSPAFPGKVLRSAPDMALHVRPVVEELHDENQALRNAVNEEIDNRARAEAAADSLAYAIAPQEVIGEHSSGNDPWDNALDEVDLLHYKNERLSAEVVALRQVIDKVRELADDWEKKPKGFDPHKKLTDRSAGYWDGRSSTFTQCSGDLRAVLVEVAPTTTEEARDE